MAQLFQVKILKKKKQSYNKEYISITRKEFETAQKLNIPAFILIEKNVYTEFHTYKKNKAFFDKENNFKFAHVDDLNVFKFIDSIKGIAIKTFEKVDDIEGYLGNQIAGMLYLYLQQLQDITEDKKILDSVSELKSISKRMNEMLVAVGKNVIQDDNFKDVIFKQNTILVEFFIGQFIDNIKFTNDYDINTKELGKVMQGCMSTVLKPEFILSLEEDGISNVFDLMNEKEDEFKKSLLEIHESIQIEYFNYFKIYSYYRKIALII